ncbi:MAG: hypothetical protein U9Q98_08550 [Bacteroidota bacterium]|nr:hypothetical protein [Bacteroidota bacterium]
MTEEEYIRKHIVQEIRDVLKNDHLNVAFVMMALAIEILGAFLDDKPMKAKQQSKKRFRNALYHLFPGKYARLNKGDRLYEQFRNSMVHVFLPSAHIQLLNNEPSKHMEEANGKLCIDADMLTDDIENAGESILKRLNSGELRRKRIV